MAFSQIVLTGTYATESGSFATGEIEFQLTDTMTNANEVVEPTSTIIRLTTGTFSVTLDANDDTGTTPTGVGYTVIERLTVTPERSYIITLPSAHGTVDISTLMPGAPPTQ